MTVQSGCRIIGSTYKWFRVNVKKLSHQMLVRQRDQKKKKKKYLKATEAHIKFSSQDLETRMSQAFLSF